MFLRKSNALLIILILAASGCATVATNGDVTKPVSTTAVDANEKEKPQKVVTKEELDSALNASWSKKSFELAKQSEMNPSFVPFVFLLEMLGSGKRDAGSCTNFDLISIADMSDDKIRHVDVETANSPMVVMSSKTGFSSVKKEEWVNGQSTVDLKGWGKDRNANLEIWNVNACGAENKIYVLIAK